MLSDAAAIAKAEVVSLTKTAGIGLARCVEIAIADWAAPVRPEFQPAAPPPDLGPTVAALFTDYGLPPGAYVPQGSQVETPQERAKRRARQHLATLASQWDSAVAVP